MLTGTLKTQIDRVWDQFWTGGLSNPLTVIEQMTYLLFIRRLDELQTQREQKANLLKQPIEDPIFKKTEYELRWSHFKDKDPEVMYRLFTKEGGVFDFLRNVGSRSAAFNKFMKGATFMIPTPRLLAQVVEMLSNIDMDDRDTKGDVYEYLLAKIATAGQNGQFRTPRHIIRMMVDLVQPTPDNVICDPAFILGDFNMNENHPVFSALYKMGYHPAVRNQKSILKRECAQGVYLNHAIDNNYLPSSMITIEGRVIDFVNDCLSLPAARALTDHLPDFCNFSY